MFRIARAVVVSLFCAVVTFGAVPKVGDRAPQFHLPSANGSTISLKEYMGKRNVVLVFYRGYW
jgi:peroxiredoxin